jgi:hypothetical protein
MPLYIGYSMPSGGFRIDSLDREGCFPTICDMNDDGKKDIVGMGWIYSAQVFLYENIGNENYAYHNLGTYPFYGAQLLVADMNHDSLPDIVLRPGDNDGFYIMYNLGNFSFLPPAFVSVPESPQGEDQRTMCIGDFDGDGYNDVAIVKNLGGIGSSFHYANLVVLFNDEQGNFVPDPLSTGRSKGSINRGITCYPNPFHSETRIVVIGQPAKNTMLPVWNSSGIEVARLRPVSFGQNTCSYTWNGKDSHGNPCSPGVYYAGSVRVVLMN